MNIKRLTALYIIFILLLLVIVDQGDYRAVLKPFYDFPNGDKVVHVILMGLLALLVNLNFHCAQFKLFNLRILTGSALVLAIVFLEECSQLFIEGRTFDLWDLFSDVVGIVLFGQLALRFSRSHSSVSTD